MKTLRRRRTNGLCLVACGSGQDAERLAEHVGGVATEGVCDERFVLWADALCYRSVSAVRRLCDRGMQNNHRTELLCQLRWY